MIKSAGRPAVVMMTKMFRAFMTERRIPDEMNTALLRLLPKTDAGLSNLDQGETNSTNGNSNQTVRESSH